MSKGSVALKALVDTMPFAFIETNSMKYVEIIEKELKVLEIIKALRPFILVEGIGNMHYLETIVGEVILSKENYDLLKGVF